MFWHRGYLQVTYRLAVPDPSVLHNLVILDCFIVFADLEGYLSLWTYQKPIIAQLDQTGPRFLASKKGLGRCYINGTLVWRRFLELDAATWPLFGIKKT